ncbi:acyltransferase [Methylobacillus gramineus]|uniref:acyltransferase family protein n=1 Tax=Methylobacillus gramineus TaxID=755169 RepID=UPI001CFF7BED|nr:acyltransferase family protein [Methylobacillus gramineus]MCB5184279.1 acyltransferase [Methylobacillus gramineus]
MRYRREIDGLRAVAVMAVLLFHGGLLGFSGGYIGVDIFFVISGYLITTIILDEVEAGRFSIVNFYERRARRILPALTVVLIATSIAAYTMMPSSLLQAYAKSLISVASFCSNIFFYLTSGYFSTASDEKPLLHTWSLAVEEQYYLFFPLLVSMLWFIGRSRLAWLIAFLSLLSLVCSEYLLVQQAIDANFYLIFSRAWELFAGSLLAFSRVADSPLPPWGRQVGSGCGLLLIILAIFTLDQHTPFPGLYALLPVFGTCMVIAYSNQQTMVGRLLSSRLMVGLGLISYSLYLWHQPLFAFLRMKHLAEPSAGMFWIAIGISVLLAILSYYFIEQPFRNKSRFGRTRIFQLSAFSIALMLLIGLSGILFKGFPYRFDHHELAKSVESSPKREECHTGGVDFLKPEQSCRYFGQHVRWASFGDSHTVELAYALADRLKPSGQGMLHLSFSGCPPALQFEAIQPGCSQWINESLQYLENQHDISHVLIGFSYTRFLFGELGHHYPGITDESPANKFSEIYAGRSAQELRQIYWKSYEEMIHRLLKAGKTVYMLYPVPELPMDISKALTPLTIFHHESRLNLEEMTSAQYYAERNAFIIKQLDSLPYGQHLHAIKPVDILCKSGYCPAIMEGKALYFDESHLSLQGAYQLIDHGIPFDQLKLDSPASHEPR